MAPYLMNVYFFTSVSKVDQKVSYFVQIFYQGLRRNFSYSNSQNKH